MATTNSKGERGNWNTPADIVDAFQTAVEQGSPFSTDEAIGPCTETGPPGR
ncbi:hypothetical protein OG883_14270 [Streptomyces sp. NBC_01142]|uniref:hypothetical protein n=1 Tax=Streptomyces sp. NBC_01142 TaxID=2975865 RepID=UPI00225267CF|nr:hypothetical protein [Streptomyces sp. NBC_01142]MCX4821059.1 hypothetical protein [Streptomyces sp. NBC_01142]